MDGPKRRRNSLVLQSELNMIFSFLLLQLIV